jgi:hypothetical protein
VIDMATKDAVKQTHGPTRDKGVRFLSPNYSGKPAKLPSETDSDRRMRILKKIMIRDEHILRELAK